MSSPSQGFASGLRDKDDRNRGFLERRHEAASGVLRVCQRAVETLLRKRSPGAPRGARYGALVNEHRAAKALTPTSTSIHRSRIECSPPTRSARRSSSRPPSSPTRMCPSTRAREGPDGELCALRGGRGSLRDAIRCASPVPRTRACPGPGSRATHTSERAFILPTDQPT